ncbi:hypothetical protein CYY_005521 [Polysphondylium violaceum]|uniref:UbiA prenyltransferase family protein n=1 Tax=Polysphondylium violaceum TaxID=133409 RepID=A0A8J4UZJ7_9MYCE|nr:hypothetical protein CYY_005521 [Polysphondylium violaceum]
MSINYRKLEGFIHGSRLVRFNLVISYILVGFTIGYKESGQFPFSCLFVIPIFLCLFSVVSILNALCDFEAKIDIKETSVDRTMFDYGLSVKDIWNFVYFNLVLITIFSFLSFWDWDFKLKCYGFLNIIMDSIFCLFYNLPPFRLKTKLFGGEISVLLSYLSIVNLSYCLVTKNPSLTICFIHFPAVVFIAWGMMVNLFVDMEDDKRDGSFSSAIFFGETITKFLIVIIPTLIYISTIKYAIEQNNMFALLPLLTVPLKYIVIELAFKKNKQAKPTFFVSILIFNGLYIIGNLLN